MAFVLRNVRKIADLPYNTTNGFVQLWGYSSSDAAAIVLASGYFNALRSRLKLNDVIEVIASADGVGDLVTMKVTAVPAEGAGDVTVSTEGGASANRAATATADGLTTGLLTAGDRVVDVTSGNAAHLVTLPPIADVPINFVMRLSVGANGHKLATPATSNTKINNGDSDGTALTAIPANSITIVTKQAVDNWIAECFVAAGTRTIPTPA